MKTTNQVGLDNAKSEELANLLNDLLANYSVFYQNTKGYHWNIQGNNFFELHQKFEELYNNLLRKTDELAERILTLGHLPNYKYTCYLESSTIKESNQVTDGIKSIVEILSALKILLSKQRQILNFTSEIEDEGTNSLMSDYIREQEKLTWMYSAYLK